MLNLSSFVVHRTLWGDLASQFCNIYNNNKSGGHVIVLLQNVRIKGAEVSKEMYLYHQVLLSKMILLKTLNIPTMINSYGRHKYKLEVHAFDSKHKAKFIFWDNDCAKLFGISVVDLKTKLVEAGEDDPLEFPYPLDSMLNKELAIRAIYQPKFDILSIVGFKDCEDSIKKLKDQFST
ncbi:hypothetical protein KIW84_031367 [Lathyrus oleraceus]|uniref:Uncharacterized protein n=1 Tax=Pisum sativum TaxID=3888 RepID=A0A9D4XSX6_PEA|nr:hypothetical protein KIW84_031367 [Pisum sativum]